MRHRHEAAHVLKEDSPGPNDLDDIEIRLDHATTGIVRIPPAVGRKSLTRRTTGNQIDGSSQASQFSGIVFHKVQNTRRSHRKPFGPGLSDTTSLNEVMPIGGESMRVDLYAHDPFEAGIVQAKRHPPATCE